MIKKIIKKELIRYFKNPLYYLAAIFIIIIVYGELSPYLNIIHLTSPDQLKDVKEYSEENRYSSDLDVQHGYIPNSEDDMYKKGLEAITAVLIDGYGIDKKKTESLIGNMQDKKMNISEIAGYINEKLSRSDTIYFFLDYSMKKGTVEEINSYVDKKMSEKNYTDYFGRKYIDYFGLNIIFSGMILLAFLYFSDMKKDMYELLHSKAVKPRQYIIGKIAGGFLAILSICIIATTVFDIIAIRHGMQNGFSINFLDMWKNVLFFVLPNILVMVNLYTLVTLLFRNPLPAIPVLLLYMVYSNVGAGTKVNGVFQYEPRVLSLLVRMPDRFFETFIEPKVIMNQILLMVLSVFLAGCSIMIWKRRRLP